MKKAGDIAVDPGALAEVEQEVRRALHIGDDGHLDVLGYGEVSCVLSVESNGEVFAVKRLPRFEDQEDFDVYRTVFSLYLEKLAQAGVDLVESDLKVVDDEEGGIQAYCVQPRYDSTQIGPNILRHRPKKEGRRFLDQVVNATAGAVDDELGIDAQLSNWIDDGEKLKYLDVTTPLIRNSTGQPLLDTGLFLAALPWALRGVVDAFLVDEIISQYHDRRRALLDMAANLHKERLSQWIPEILELINRHISPPITLEETKNYYRRDARMWEALLLLRRLDRTWQRWVRRRPYPYLLPGEIER